MDKFHLSAEEDVIEDCLLRSADIVSQRVGR